MENKSITIEKIILTRMNEPIDKLSLEPNERIVKEYWKVSYENLIPIENFRGEIQRYREIIERISSIRQNEPKEIIIFF